MNRFEPSARPLLNFPRDTTNDQSTPNASSSRLPPTDQQLHEEQEVSDIASANGDQSIAKQSPKHHPTALVSNSSRWTRALHTVNRLWKRSWTTETISLGFSIFTLAGLIATLLAHQHKPLPQWPQLVSINSIISLFSLLMRSCVGVVLAEGT
jgi:hypothetical protein